MRPVFLFMIIACLITISSAAQKGSRAVTQTLKTEGYLKKCIPVSINIQGFMDENSGMCNKVILFFEDSRDQVIITTMEDYSAKDSKHGAKKMVFREPAESAYLLSQFEAQQISKVCRTLVKVLEAFDESLEKGKWDRCQGLDSYLLRFLKGFNFLISCASNNTVSLIPAKHCPDSIYGIAVDLPKLEARINHWKTDAQSRTKLHTVLKELLYQCRIWQRDLSQQNQNQDIMINERFIKAMNIFIKIYLEDNYK
ncbi:MAG: hypothetical protein GX267_07215 [Fibrobacter sp.]|nr:hypothetical protein [Fibrobacter sp.]